MTKIKMIKKLVVISLLGCWFPKEWVAQGQQLPLYSHFIMNDFIINPAVAGRNDYNLIQSNLRYQWVGINDAPKTIILSANIPYKIKKVGLGGYLFNDKMGAVSRTGFNLAYAYHIHIDEEYKLGLGVNGGLLQYRINGPELILADEAERYLFDAVETATTPDASLGMYLYSNSFFLGLSFNHLFKNKVAVKLFDKTAEHFGRLSRHTYITGGGRFKVHDLFELEPSALIKYSSPSQLQFDISTRIFYRKEIWMGITCRTKDAVVVLAGYDYKEKLQIAYSYDITTSHLKKYSDGSHELMLGYRFYSNKKETKTDKKSHRALE
jgi:type IX secretion system PorP/SprF family membrane protein